MSDTKENIFKDLIDDYENSIHSLQARLKTAENAYDVSTITRQLEQYKNQLSKLRMTINHTQPTRRSS